MTRPGPDLNTVGVRRRVLRRIGLLVCVSFLLAAPLGGCSGGKGDGDSSLPPDARGATAVAAQFPGGLVERPVLQARRLLIAMYYREPDERALDDAAWSAARRAAESAGIDASGLAPVFGADATKNEATLAGSLAGVFERVSSDADAQEITSSDIEGMARSLGDNHTRFVRPEQWRAVQSGENVGFGWVSRQDETGIVLREVSPGTPAASAGLLPGDLVLAADGTGLGAAVVEGQHLQEGRPVRLTVDRLGRGVFDVVATPRRLASPVLATRLIDGAVGYVALYRFPPPDGRLPDGRLFDEALAEEMKRLAGRGACAWVLDLRSNGGGNRSALQRVAGAFGLKGDVLEAVARGGLTEPLAVSGPSLTAGGPVAVLIDASSASASEIVATALKDSGLAYLVGGRTAGVVNSSAVVEVARGGLAVTVAQVYAGPKHRYLDGAGIEPDAPVELTRADIVANRDPQLERALAYLRERAFATPSAR